MKRSIDEAFARPLAPAVFRLWSLAAGLTFALLTPPFAVPDEPAHFFRAWAISEGRFAAERLPDGRVGGPMPAAVVDFVAEHAAQIEPGRRGVPFRPTAGETAVVDYRNAAQLPAALYLPQALTLAVARAAGVAPSPAFHAARLANLLVSSLLLAVSLERLPAGRSTAAAIYLLPMALALRASLSPDALGLALGALFVAEAARFVLRAPGGSPPRAAPLFTASLGLGLMKIVYLPLALVAFAQRRPRHGWAALALALAVAVPAARAGARVDTPMRFDVAVDPAQNWNRLASAPGATLARLAGDLAVHAPRYAAQAIGARPRGWEPAPARRWAAAAGGAALAVMVAIELALYVQWTPSEARWVEGVQGRYFLPLALPLALALAALPDAVPRLSERASGLLAVGIALVSAMSGLLALRARYG